MHVNHTAHEFTLDFIRMDIPRRQRERGVLAARVAVSPSLVLELIEALQANWQRYARKALPKEVYGDEPEAEGDDQDFAGG